MSDSPPSFEEGSLVGSDMDYEPMPSTSREPSTGGGVSRGRRRPARGTRRAPRGSAGRGRGRRGGRARGRVLAGLSRADFDRVTELQRQRIDFEEARIQRLTLDECRQLLQQCLTREPSLIFDIMTLTPDPPPPGPLPPQSPSWCICGNCRNMPSQLESKCCQQLPQNCISMLPHMELYILQEGVLRLARRLWNDLRAEHDTQEGGESNRQFRYAAYRNFVVWQYGVLGPGNRIVIPSCCVWKIRDRFPDPNGFYVGFVPARL